MAMVYGQNRLSFFKTTQILASNSELGSILFFNESFTILSMSGIIFSWNDLYNSEPNPSINEKKTDQKL